MGGMAHTVPPPPAPSVIDAMERLNDACTYRRYRVATCAQGLILTVTGPLHGRLRTKAFREHQSALVTRFMERDCREYLANVAKRAPAATVPARPHALLRLTPQELTVLRDSVNALLLDAPEPGRTHLASVSEQLRGEALAFREVGLLP